MGDVVTAESKTVTYTAGVPDSELNDEFKLEGNLMELDMRIKINYDTDGVTAPTAPAGFPAQDRIFGIIKVMKYKINGKSFHEMLGKNLRQFIALFYEDDEYDIDELGITTGISGENKYASITLPISKPKTVKEIDYDITLENDAVLSANDKYVVNNVQITFIPVYGASDRELQVVYSNKTINGLEDYDINEDLGFLMALIIDGYNTTPNLEDLVFKVDRIELINVDYSEYYGEIRRNTFGAITKDKYPNVVIFKFKDMIDVSDINKTIISKLKTSGSQLFTITQIFVEKVNPEVTPTVAEYQPTLAHDTSKSAMVDDVPTTTSQQKEIPKKKKDFAGFKV